MNETDVDFGAYTDFGTLRAAIVGSAEGLTLPPFNPTLHHYNKELQSALKASGQRPLDVRTAMPERWEKTVIQLDALADLYQQNGVRVYRPRGYSSEEHRYLAELQPGASLLYPADPVYTVGKHYIEVNIRRAYRRKEVFPLRDLVAPLLAADPEAHHVVMPAALPFAPSYAGPGPYLEGGDIVCYKKHLFVGESGIASNRAGTEWLKSYIEPYGYEVHPMPMKGNLLHLLGIMVLVREGVLLLFRDELDCELPAPIRDWDVIEISQDEAAAYATVGVSLDDRRYVMPTQLGRIGEELSRRGIEPIEFDYENVSYWGGCLSCSTHAIARDP